MGRMTVRLFVALAALAVPSVASARTVAFVGDSLAIGTGPNLRHDLPGWRVHVDARIGRPLEEGIDVIRRRRHVRVLAVSLFTNNDPHQAAELPYAIRVAEHHARCVVWATVSRPPVGGVSYAEANRVLRNLRSRKVRIVHWARAARLHPGWLGPDRVHPDQAGYRALARMYATAIRRCSAT